MSSVQWLFTRWLNEKRLLIHPRSAKRSLLSPPNKIGYQTKATKHEALSCFRSSVDRATNYRAIKDAIGRGVKVKFIAEYNRKNKHKIQQLLQLGVEVRKYDEQKFGKHGTRFNVFDEKISRITIGKPEITNSEEYITIWAESQSLANLLRRQFYSMWEGCPLIKRIELCTSKSKESWINTD